MIGCLSMLPVLTFFTSWLSTPLAPQVIGESFRHVNTHEKVVALTFDDGPNPEGTPGILDLLERENIKATFFLIGNRVQQYPELAKRIWSAGHQIGNHTWSHSLMMFKDPEFIKQEIEKTDTILRQLGYTQEIYFRAPYGMKLLLLPMALRTMHKKHILFDSVAYDWTSPGVETIVHNVITSVRPGSIILLHDGVGNQHDTLLATEIIIRILKDQGYRFVTVAQLLTYHQTNLTDQCREKIERLTDYCTEHMGKIKGFFNTVFSKAKHKNSRHTQMPTTPSAI